MRAEAPSDVVHEELTLYAEDGTRLYAQRWAPPGSAKAELLVLPGYADHSGRYLEFAHALAHRGIAVVAVDLRGHGHSAGSRGYVRRFADYHGDARAAFAQLREDKPRFLLGHSQGGLLAFHLMHAEAWAEALTGVVICSPYLGLAMKISAPKMLLANLAGRALPGLALPSGLRPEDMSRDFAMVEAYRRDPVVFRTATAAWVRESSKAQNEVLALRDFPRPLLLYFSPDDPVAEARISRDYAAQLECPDKTVREVPGAKHELLNETDRTGRTTEIADWILSHAKS
jgi:alpha-beta hydrolase superfamily lysophospholipase